MTTKKQPSSVVTPLRFDVVLLLFSGSGEEVSVESFLRLLTGRTLPGTPPSKVDKGALLSIHTIDFFFCEKGRKTHCALCVCAASRKKALNLSWHHSSFCRTVSFWKLPFQLPPLSTPPAFNAHTSALIAGPPFFHDPLL